MNISERKASTWKSIFKAIVIYAAGAWASIEVVDFAVTRYGLSRLLLDASVVVAFGGGMITAVLAWFHSEPGQQKIKKLEVAIVSTIILTTAAGIAYLATQSPTADFDRLDGYRLTFEFRQNSLAGEENRYFFRAGPMLGSEIIDEGFFYFLKPDDAVIKGPNIDVTFKQYPVMYRDNEEEWVTITIVLPSEPTALANLRNLGSMHDRLKIELRNLSVNIDERFEILDDPTGVTLKFKD